jgi:hypothetical protein
MSQSIAVGDVAAPAAAHQHPVPDQRRKLQLALGVSWLLDAMLQFQPFMFGRGFGRMLADSAHGNPAIVAGPVTWSAALIGHHAAVLNAIFAVTQLLLGLGIAWRPTVRLALAASAAWSLAVWWLGEGLGGLLAGQASPVNGAPGAVLLYALLAVLLWPADRDHPGRDHPAPFPAAHAASALARHGLPAAILLAAVLTALAVAIYLPRRLAPAALAAALVVAALLWLAQGLGGILTGSATDPDTGPLLALLALSFWPAATPAAPSQGQVV